MLKKLLVGGLIVTVMIAIGTSAYNVVFTRAAEGETEAAINVDGANLPLESSQDNETGFGQGQQKAGVLPAQGTPTPGNGLPSSPQAGNPEQGNPHSPSYGNGSGSGQGNQYGQGRGQGQGKGQGRGWGRGGGNEAGSGQGSQQLQNGFQEWITLQGVVSNTIAPNFTLLTDDGHSIAAQLGNLNYVENIGLSLQEGERVTVMGFYDPEGGLAIGQITLQSSGQTFTLRDELGRPLWAGGANR